MADSTERVVTDHITGEDFRVALCTCGCRHVLDPPAPADLVHYYDNPSGQAMHSTPGRLFAFARRRAMGRELRPLLSRLAPGSVVADVGAGDGSLVGYVASRGFPVAAIDVYPADEWGRGAIPYRQYTPGAPIGPVLDELGRIDAVVMRHVLEHLPDPVATLRELAGHGVRWVWVIVPNAGSALRRVQGANWYYWDPPRHLTFFTPPSLHAIAGRSGYRIATESTAGLDEVVTGIHRAALLRHRRRPSRALARLADACHPTRLLAGVSSALAAPLANTVCTVLMELGEAEDTA